MSTNLVDLRSVRACALLVLLGVAACARSTSDAAASEDIRVVGEKAGVLVWHPVNGASRYLVEILDVQGRVIHDHHSADTVSPLPPLFSPESGTRWWVRAYKGDKQIAASTRQEIF